MKPYLAVLIDAFWEALGNKVLWALLIGWTLLLGALAPFGLISEATYELSVNDLSDRTQLLEKLAGRKASGKKDAAINKIRDLLPQEFIEQLKEAADSNKLNEIQQNLIVDTLNQSVLSADLYDPKTFPRAAKQNSLKDIVAQPQDQISDEEKTYLNRELLSQTFRLEIRSPLGEQLWLGYAGFKLGSPLGMSRQVIRERAEPVAISLIVKLGLGVVAIGVALIVTSNIIPDTFQPGSLHLLLSKPISRVLLFLTRFLSSSIFVSLNISFVLLGLFLIAGSRFDSWNLGILYCIPVLIFVFLIFYTISALTGLIWQNAIVSIVACIIFWFFCYVIGGVENGMRAPATSDVNIHRIAPVDNELLVADSKGRLLVWNSEFSVWQPAIEFRFGPQFKTLGPVKAPDSDRVFTKTYTRDPFGGLRARSREMSMFNLGEANDGDSNPKEKPAEGKAQEANSKLIASKPEIQSVSDALKEPHWSFELGPEVPRQPVNFLQSANGIIIACRTGIFQFDPNMVFVEEEKPKFSLFGAENLLPNLNKANNPFTPVGPDNYFLGANSSVSLAANENDLIVFDGGNLEHLTRDSEANYVIQSSTKIEGNSRGGGVAILNASHCIVARPNSPLVVLDSSLSTQREIELPEGESIRQIGWIGKQGTDGFILFDSGTAKRINCKDAKLEKWDLQRNGNISSIEWLDNDVAYIACRPNAVYKINTASSEVLESYVPRDSTFQWFYKYLVRPVYTVCPKPTSLDETMMYLLTGSTSMDVGLLGPATIDSAKVELQIWEPIISNSAFILVFLVLASIYIARREF